LRPEQVQAADQQFGRDRGATSLAVVRGQRIARPGRVWKPIYPAQDMIGG
jgi:hypothetical protein